MKNSISLTLFALILVAAFSCRSTFKPSNLSPDMQSCPSAPLMMKGTTPAFKRSSPSLAAMTRHESIRNFLAGKTNTIYGDLTVGTAQTLQKRRLMQPVQSNSLTTFGTPVSEAQYAEMQAGHELCEPMPAR
ncbi:MAG: hypothetical protein WCT03_14965 [Candidatus Obscuribacterales bacterium]